MNFLRRKVRIYRFVDRKKYRRITELAMNRLSTTQAEQSEKISEISDEMLMEQYAAYESIDAFEELYHRYYEELLRYLNKSYDFSLCEEAIDDVFFKIAKNPDLFDTSRRFRAWIYPLSYNKATDLYRRLKYIKSRTLEASCLEVNEESTYFNSVPSPDKETDGNYPIPLEEVRDRIEEVLTSINFRNPDIPNMFIDVALNGLKYREAAAKYNVPIGTVKSRMNKVLLDLQSMPVRRYVAA